jgi:hypothetical protein
MYGPIKSTTVHYKFSANHDVLDIVITKDLVTPVYLITCSELSLDHLPVLIDTQCRSSLLNLPDPPDLRTGWVKFQACLEAGLPSEYVPPPPNEMAIDVCQ